MFFNLLMMLIISLMSLTFLVGLILFMVGRFRKSKNNALTKVGLILAGIPTAIFALLLLLSIFGEIYSSKPDSEDLVGTYHIVKITHLDFNQDNYNKSELHFFENGTFTLTPTPYIEVCESGRYKVNYSFKSNELSLECPKIFNSAHIVREYGSYKIEFMIGDPDRGASIYFGRVDE